MSQINFESLTRERPDLANTWHFLHWWFASHSRVNVVSLPRLVSAAKEISATDLTKALQVLIDEGFVREVFQVVDHDGVLINRDYDSIASIPARVSGRLNEVIETAETDVVPVYLLEAGATDER